jgi:uncharacterized protein (TIGR00369 family)
MTIAAAGPGTATLTMPVTRTMTNGHGMCHGGYIFTLADSAPSLSPATATTPGPWRSTAR